MAELDYDGSQYEEERQLIPEGRYPAVVYKTEFVDLKNYAGKGCRVTFQILGSSPFHGSFISSIYPIYHTDIDKQNIARQIFARLCRYVIGRPNPRNTDELLHRTLEIEVVVNGEYNNVKRVFASTQNTVPTSTPPEPSMAPPIATTVHPPLQPQMVPTTEQQTLGGCPF